LKACLIAFSGMHIGHDYATAGRQPPRRRPL